MAVGLRRFRHLVRWIVAVTLVASSVSMLTHVAIAAEPKAVPSGTAAPKPAASATPSAKPPAPKPPPLVEVPFPEQVKVISGRPLKAYRADELIVGPLPESFRGSAVVTRPIGKPSDDVQGGRIELEVVADGPVVIAASWQFDGTPEPSWSDEVWDGRKFSAEGWRLIDAVDLPDARSYQPTLHLVYLRNCKAGEKFAIRTRKYNPPAVLIPSSPPDEGRIVDWEPSRELPEERQRDLVAQKFRALLMEERFDELERWTTRYMKADAMFPSGHFKIVSTRRLVTHNYPFNRLTEAESRQFLDLCEAWLTAMPRSIPARLTTANLIVVALRAIGEFRQTEKRFGERPGDRRDSPPRAGDSV